MTGPGKYDDLCTELREKTRAVGAIVIIVEGNQGNGFSVQGPLPVVAQLPQMLRFMADQIERDAQNGLPEKSTTKGKS